MVLKILDTQFNYIFAQVKVATNIIKHPAITPGCSMQFSMDDIRNMLTKYLPKTISNFILPALLFINQEPSHTKDQKESIRNKVFNLYQQAREKIIN